MQPGLRVAIFVATARASFTAVAAVQLDVELTALAPRARPRPLEDWLTMFPLAPVVLDPYTEQSARILRTARRILVNYQGAGCRTCWVLTCDADGARRYLGEWAQDVLTFIDPDRRVVGALGLDLLPAFALIRQDGTVAAQAQGWTPASWRAVAEAVSAITEWKRPLIGGDEDPEPFAGTRARP